MFRGRPDLGRTVYIVLMYTRDGQRTCMRLSWRSSDLVCWRLTVLPHAGMTHGTQMACEEHVRPCVCNAPRHL